MIIFEFINQDLVTFISARTSPKFFPPLSPNRTCGERPEKYYNYSCEVYSIIKASFLLFDKHEYAHRIFPSSIQLSSSLYHRYVDTCEVNFTDGTEIETKSRSNFTSNINPFQPNVVFLIETNHLFCSAKQMTGFYKKCNTGLKWVKRI